MRILKIIPAWRLNATRRQMAEWRLDIVCAVRITWVAHVKYPGRRNLNRLTSLIKQAQGGEWRSLRITGNPRRASTLLTQKPWIVPISGTTQLHRLEENLGAVEVRLTLADLKEIDENASHIALKGERLPKAALDMTGR